MIDPIRTTAVVTPAQSSTVPHRVGDLITSPGERHLVVYSSETPAVSLLSETWQRREIELSQPTGSLCMSIDSTGSLLAFASPEDDRLYVRHLGSDQQMTVQHRSELVDVRFDGRGRLWTIRRGAERFVVEMRAAGTWEMLADSEFSDACFLRAELRPSPSGDAMFVAAYSGHGDHENYLCEAEHDSLQARHIPAMDGQQIVFLSPDDATALTLDHMTCEVACFRHPFNASIARLPWPDYVEGECEDELPGYFGCYVDGGHFLAGSADGRLFLIELTPFRVRKEIQVAGHTPVSASIKHPSLSDACGFVSDLLVFGRCGNSVAAFFAKNHRSPCPRLIILPITDLVGSDMPAN